MADEKDDQTPEELKGKVLIAKLGYEQEFSRSLNEASMVGNGNLKYRGHAELMYDLGLLESIGIQVPKNLDREQTIEFLENFLKQCYLEQIMQYGEWVTKEEAEKRQRTKAVLYGQKE